MGEPVGDAEHDRPRSMIVKMDLYDMDPPEPEAIRDGLSASWWCAALG